MIGTFATIAAVFLALPFLVLGVECWLAQLPLRRQSLRKSADDRFRLAIVIPAFNEADRIGEAVTRIKRDAPDDAQVIVVADNCSDATAENAATAGATVWERQDPSKRGKGFALNFAWERLRPSPPDVIVFIDADCEPSRGCISTVARLAYDRGRPVQAGYVMHAQRDGADVNCVSALAVYVKNVVRPRGLQYLGLPCLLTGSAMAFPAEALAKVPHPDAHIAEDLRASSEFAVAGFPPMPCMEATVSSPLPVSRTGFISQRTRWEHGHMRTILSEVPRLLVRALRTGSPSLMGLALELGVPPLSLLLGVTMVFTILFSVAGATSHNWLAFEIVCLSGAVAASGIGIMWLREGRKILPAKTLFGAIPRYIAMKLPLYLRFLFRPQKDWVRTERALPTSPLANSSTLAEGSVETISTAADRVLKKI